VSPVRRELRDVHFRLAAFGRTERHPFSIGRERRPVLGCLAVEKRKGPAATAKWQDPDVVVRLTAVGHVEKESAVVRQAHRPLPIAIGEQRGPRSRVVRGSFEKIETLEPRVHDHASSIGRPDEPVLVGGVGGELRAGAGLGVVDPEVAGTAGVRRDRDGDARAVGRQLDVAVIGHRSDAAQSCARAIEPRETGEDRRARASLLCGEKPGQPGHEDEADRNRATHGPESSAVQSLARSTGRNFATRMTSPHLCNRL